MMMGSFNIGSVINRVTRRRKSEAWAVKWV